jgi:hypothetical protein
MKVAVCVSGMPRSAVKGGMVKNVSRLRSNFPDADIFFGTWLSCHDIFKSNLPEETALVFPDPIITYHPFIDIPDELITTPKLRKTVEQAKTNPTFRETSSHQTKQILAHARMVLAHPDYDVYIRVRYDTFTHNNTDFNKFVVDAFENKRAIGFATLRPDWERFNAIREMNNDTDYWNQFLFDQLIIHHNEVFNTDRVFTLNKRKQLIAAEFGWYQVMSKPYGDNHRCMSGWANPDKSMDPRFLI